MPKGLTQRNIKTSTVKEETGLDLSNFSFFSQPGPIKFEFDENPTKNHANELDKKARNETLLPIKPRDRKQINSEKLTWFSTFNSFKDKNSFHNISETCNHDFFQGIELINNKYKIFDIKWTSLHENQLFESLCNLKLKDLYNIFLKYLKFNTPIYFNKTLFNNKPCLKCTVKNKQGSFNKKKFNIELYEFPNILNSKLDGNDNVYYVGES
jgi:hypothetical protein